MASRSSVRQVPAPISQDLVALARHDTNKNLPALFRGIDQLQRRWPQWRELCGLLAEVVVSRPGAAMHRQFASAKASRADQCAATG